MNRHRPLTYLAGRLEYIRCSQYVTLQQHAEIRDLLRDH